MRTSAEAVRLPKGEQEKIGSRKQFVEQVHDIDERKFDYIVAPINDPDVKGRNPQTASALGANTPGNGYTICVNADYYGDGTHVMLARAKDCSEAKAEQKEKRALYPQVPKGTLKTVVNSPNFVFRTDGESVRPGNISDDSEERAAARKAAVESDPEQAAVLEKMLATADSGNSEEVSE